MSLKFLRSASADFIVSDWNLKRKLWFIVLSFFSILVVLIFLYSPTIDLAHQGKFSSHSSENHTPFPPDQGGAPESLGDLNENTWFYYNLEWDEGIIFTLPERKNLKTIILCLDKIRSARKIEIYAFGNDRWDRVALIRNNEKLRIVQDVRVYTNQIKVNVLETNFKGDTWSRINEIYVRSPDRRTLVGFLSKNYLKIILITLLISVTLFLKNIKTFFKRSLKYINEKEDVPYIGEVPAKLEYVLIGLIILAAVVLRMYTLDERGVAFPDPSTYYHQLLEDFKKGVEGEDPDSIQARLKGFQSVLTLAGTGEASRSKSAHLVLGALGFLLFGIGPGAPLFIVAFLGVLTVWLVYKIGKENFNAQVGLLSATFLSFSCLHIQYSRSFFSHIPASFFLTLSILLFLRAERGSGPYRNLIFSGLSMGLAFSFHPGDVAFAFILALALLAFNMNTFRLKASNLVYAKIFLFSGAWILTAFFFVFVSWILQDSTGGAETLFNVWEDIIIRTHFLHSIQYYYLIPKMIGTYDGAIPVFLSLLGGLLVTSRVLSRKARYPEIVVLTFSFVMIYGQVFIWPFALQFISITLRRFVVSVPFLYILASVGFFYILSFLEPYLQNLRNRAIMALSLLILAFVPANIHSTYKLIQVVRNPYVQVENYLILNGANKVVFTDSYFENYQKNLMPTLFSLGKLKAVTLFSQKFAPYVEEADFLFTNPFNIMDTKIDCPPVFTVPEPHSSYYPLFYQAMVDNRSPSILETWKNPSPLVRSISVFNLKECQF